MKTRLAIITTHPIQYYAPVFRALAALPDIELKVFYTWSQASSDAGTFDAEFETVVRWDVPLLDGYAHEFVDNVSSRPGTDHFLGIRTPGLVRAVRNWRPDAVLIYTWNSYSHLKAMWQFKGNTPVFFRGDSTMLDAARPFRQWVRKRVLKSVYRQIDCAIAVGTNNRHYFEAFGVPRANLGFAPHSVDIKHFADDDGAALRKARALRQDLKIPESAFVLIFAGKLIPKKSPDLLLDAFRRIRTDWHLVYVGDGAMKASLQQDAQSASNIHFLPFQNQSLMPAVYRIGNAFILPSGGPGETWGLALNEAMASARPVIASTKVGGAQDLIQTGVNGWMFEAGNLNDLCKVLAQLTVCDPPQLDQMGEQSLRIIQQWSSEVSARMIGRVINDFLRVDRPVSTVRSPGSPA